MKRELVRGQGQRQIEYVKEMKVANGLKLNYTAC